MLVETKTGRLSEFCLMAKWWRNIFNNQYHTLCLWECFWSLSSSSTQKSLSAAYSFFKPRSNFSSCSLSLSTGFCSYGYQPLSAVLSSQPARRSETGSYKGVRRLWERDRKGRTREWYPSTSSYTDCRSPTVGKVIRSELLQTDWPQWKYTFCFPVSPLPIPLLPSTQMLKKSLISTSVGYRNILVTAHAFSHVALIHPELLSHSTMWNFTI